MTQNAPTPGPSGTTDAMQTGGRHGLTESQDPQAPAKRSEQADDAAGAAHEVRVRSNYQTPLGDAAAAADARAGNDSGGPTP